MNKDLLLIIVGVVTLFSIVVFLICKNKKRNPWGWIIFVNLSGFIFNFAPFIILIILIFLPTKGKSFGGVSVGERTINIPNMSKDEYINKYNDGTHISKVTLEEEWKNNKKKIDFRKW